MNRPFTLLTVLYTVILFAGLALTKPQKASEDMILILIHHKSGPNDLDARGLPEDKNMKAPDKAGAAEFEVYEVPYPRGIADYFGYRVYLHGKTGRYWINITGGVGGVYRFHGPGNMKDLRK